MTKRGLPSKTARHSIESHCYQALEAALHRELIEIAKLYGVTESSSTLRRLARIGIRREPFLSIASDQTW